MQKQKIITIAIALFLAAIISFSAVQTPNVAAADDRIEIPTYAYLVVNPNPVGVGQRINIIMWAGVALPNAAVTNDVRWHDYKLVITNPDGQNETKTWPIATDTTSTQFYQYTPNKAGNYSIVFSYPDLNYTWSTSATYQYDVFKGATSKTITLTVQEELIPDPITSYPMPTEYWTRPIEGQNTDWWSVTSNWLGATHPSIASGIRFQQDGSAPNSAHILWTKPIDEGGIVGGNDTGVTGNMYYTGLSYNARFTNPIIMNGRLFYGLPNQNSGTGGGYMAVDLLTGETLWYSDQMGTSSSAAPTFGYLYGFNSENQHGAIPPGLLFQNNFARAVNPVTGQFVLNVTGVPSGTAVVGPQGEILRYTLTNASNTWLLAQWNSSKVVYPAGSLGVNQPATVGANAPLTPAKPTSALSYYQAWNWNGTAWVIASSSQATTPNPTYDWNVTLSYQIPADTAARFAILDDILIGSTNLGSEASTGSPNPYTIWAISLKPESRGNLLWSKNYTIDEGITIRLPTLDPVNRLFIYREKETMVFKAYSIDNGNLVWTTKPIDNVSDWEYFDVTFSGQFFMPAYGKLYHAGVSGIIYCYDGKDGSLLWTNGNDRSDPKNNTYSGGATSWGVYPQYIEAIADGKLFIGTGEHSPDSPLWKGAKVRAINATTGQEIWSVMGYTGFPGRVFTAVADGVYVYDNLYNQEITAFGKGPSTTTVDAPMTASKLGDSIVIRGTVADISAGTQQKEQAARFPNGVPAVSDESQGAWMEYVYMQKPCPTNVTGVPVTIGVLDANGNYRNVGTVKTNDGFFSLNWKPDIEGPYTVYATFAGSNSYYPSHATTSFVVDPAPATPTPTAAPEKSMADLYFLPAIIGLFVAIIVVGLLTILMLRKRP